MDPIDLSSSSTSSGLPFFEPWDEAEIDAGRPISMNSIGGMNNAVLDAEPELPGLQFVTLDESAQELPDESSLQQQEGTAGASTPKQPEQQQLKQQPGVQQQKHGVRGNKQQRLPQQRLQLSSAHNTTSSGNSSSSSNAGGGSSSSSRWSFSRLSSGIFRRAGRQLQQTIFPEGMSKLSMDQLYPGLQSSSDPNMPFGTGRTGWYGVVLCWAVGPWFSFGEDRLSQQQWRNSSSSSWLPLDAYAELATRCAGTLGDLFSGVEGRQ
jgi:hypothetical protein